MLFYGKIVHLINVLSWLSKCHLCFYKYLVSIFTRHRFGLVCEVCKNFVDENVLVEVNYSMLQEWCKLSDRFLSADIGREKKASIPYRVCCQ